MLWCPTLLLVITYIFVYLMWYLPNSFVDVPVEFVDHQDGTYEVVFEPEVAGKYDVSVGLAADDTPGEEEGPLVHFEHSPFVTEINPASGNVILYIYCAHLFLTIYTEVSPADSIVSRSPSVLPNGDRVFQVTLKDKDGKNIPFSGVPIVANIFAKRPNGKSNICNLKVFVIRLTCLQKNQFQCLLST